MTTRLDWERARGRVAAAREAPSPADERAVLAERARVLALPLDDETDDAQARDVVVFTVCGERFAVAAAHVIEALPIGLPTPVPGTPERVLGVINHRGRVLGVLDLRDQLVADGSRDGELTHAVAVEVDGLCFALAVEAVQETGRERAGAQLTVLDLATVAADPRLRIDDD